jgi:hypothetical protein
MPWQKGKAGNPGGRPKEDAEVRQLARIHGGEAIKTLAGLMNSKDPKIQVSAANAVLDRGFGKPSQTLDLTAHKSHEEWLVELKVG